MAQSSRKDLSRTKHASPPENDELVPIRFELSEELYALLEQIAQRSGKSVGEVASMYLTVAVDSTAKTDPSVDRAMEQLVAEDIARRFGLLLRLLGGQKSKKNIPN
jgi:hypothetical protein